MIGFNLPSLRICIGNIESRALIPTFSEPKSIHSPVSHFFRGLFAVRIQLSLVCSRPRAIAVIDNRKNETFSRMHSHNCSTYILTQTRGANQVVNSRFFAKRTASVDAGRLLTKCRAGWKAFCIFSEQLRQEKRGRGFGSTHGKLGKEEITKMRD